MPSYSLLHSLFNSIFRRQPKSLLVARILYVHYLAIGFILAVLASGGIFGLLELIFGDSYTDSFCKSYFDLFYVSCQGFYSVHRIGFSLFVFYLVFCLEGSVSVYFSMCMCLGRPSDEDSSPSARIHAFKSSPARLTIEKILLFLQTNIFLFLFKGLFFIICIIIPWLIPDVFFFAWAIVSMIGAIIFLLIQMLMIIHFAHSWFEAWIGKEGKFSVWLALIFFFSVLFNLIGVIMTGFEIWLYGSRSNCHLNRVFIIATFLCSIPLVVLSIVRGKGILPPSIIFLFATFTCWSALLSNPEQDCNLLAPDDPNQVTWSKVLTIVISISIALLSLIKAALSTGSSFAQVVLLKRASTVIDEADDTASDAEDPIEQISRIKKERKEIFYSLVTLALASCYMATTLTNWNIMTPNWEFHFAEYTQNVPAHISMVIVKMCTVFLMYALFGWSLIAPLVLKNRDFGEDDDW